MWVKTARAFYWRQHKEPTIPNFSLRSREANKQKPPIVVAKNKRGSTKCCRFFCFLHLHRAARLWMLTQRWRFAVAANRWLIAGRIAVLAFVILLEAGHNTQISLAFGTMVLGFAPQNPTVRIDCVPTEIAAERRSGPNDRTVLRTVFDGQFANGLSKRVR